jgi:glucose/arabinose dehydrogenase
MPTRRRTPHATLFLTAALTFLSAAVFAHADARTRADTRTHVHADSQQQRAPRLVPRRVELRGRAPFSLRLPEGYDVSVAAEGLKRVRFMALSPDGRVFVTDMYNLADNRRGAVYILEGFDAARKTFARRKTYLSRLRNPNSVAFHTDARGQAWLYLALTDRLVRYRYRAGDDAPAGEPEVLATFPDYGLSYKYGGWHLTRTVVVTPQGKVYVSVGSSCNACEEKEEVRASIVEMDADGRNQRHVARGLRNAVGLRHVGGRLYATNMAADHLGDHRPADTMYSIESGKHYGWPYCYQSGPRILPDPKFNPRGAKFDCGRVPAAFAAFDAHGSPLGLEFFGGDFGAELDGQFLVALHGPVGKRINPGHRVVRVGGGEGDSSRPAVTFIEGFRDGARVNGRPCDLMRFGPRGFLLTDDHAGVVYYVYKR